MIRYTFTFGRDNVDNFRRVLSRLDPDEYVVIEDIHPVDPTNERYCDWETIVDMDAEAALTFRLGMKNIKIRRERTEEELAEEKALHDANTVKVTVIVPPSQMPGGTP